MRNRIADEELAAVVGVRPVRCIERRSAGTETGDRSCRRQVFREVANALQCVRHNGIEVHRIDLTQPPVAAEEKRLVLDHRTAKGRAKIVDVQRRLAGLAMRSRVEVGFAMKLKHRAMDLVCARLCHYGHYTGSSAAILCAEVIRLDNKL